MIIIFMVMLGMYDIWRLEDVWRDLFSSDFLASVVVFLEELLISSPCIMNLNLFAIIINRIWR